MKDDLTKTTTLREESGSLHRIEEESKQQELPKQEKVFSIAKRVRSRLTNLPDTVHPPLGFVLTPDEVEQRLAIGDHLLRRLSQRRELCMPLVWRCNDG